MKSTLLKLPAAVAAAETRRLAGAAVTRDHDLPAARTVVSFADRIRSQFESLRRQRELAADLSCFRPGGELHQVRFFAHPHGLHVARWLKLLSHTQAQVQIETANPVPAYQNDFVSTAPRIPRTWKLPMMVRYVLTGLALRWLSRRNDDEIFHAHSASGNGLTAWLSGRRYMIGCYGSEIFSAQKRGPLYRWLLTRILRGAERISATSPECMKVVAEQFGVPADRLFCFHLGYDDGTFRPLPPEERRQLRFERELPTDEPVWVINRRTHPHYRTREVVTGFLQYAERHPAGRLIVLHGDNDPVYTTAILELVRQHSAAERVRIVDGLLTPGELAQWLQLSDFSVSVPKTDAFSLAMLESMGCGTIPILGDLVSYNALRPCGAIRWMANCEPENFTHIFRETAELWSGGLETSRRECVEFVSLRFSNEEAIRAIATFYLGHAPANEATVRRAA